MKKKKTLLSWSSGKDAAWALYLLQQDAGTELAGLFTVVNETHSRVAMHATREELLKQQANAVGLPLDIVYIPNPCSNQLYNDIMGAFVEDCLERDIGCMAFGDLFLSDIRRYREEQLQGAGIEPVFPLWGMPTSQLAEHMLSQGVEAYISCVDPKQVPTELSGKKWSKELIDRLPEGADPCGENGEFHTVVVRGPMFRYGIDVRIGETVEREGFVFTDIVT